MLDLSRSHPKRERYSRPREDMIVVVPVPELVKVGGLKGVKGRAMRAGRGIFRWMDGMGGRRVGGLIVVEGRGEGGVVWKRGKEGGGVGAGRIEGKGKKGDILELEHGKLEPLH
jgi:hypothetical protein